MFTLKLLRFSRFMFHGINISAHVCTFLSSVHQRTLTSVLEEESHFVSSGFTVSDQFTTHQDFEVLWPRARLDAEVWFAHSRQCLPFPWAVTAVYRKHLITSVTDSTAVLKDHEPHLDYKVADRQLETCNWVSLKETVLEYPQNLPVFKLVSARLFLLH